MAHTFNTPNYPGAPHPTPSSNSRYQLFNPKLPRPPVHNPFDKFSEKDFDTWIGNLTGDLKKALGYEDVEQPHASSSSTISDISPSSGHVAESAREVENDYLEADSYVEDSFAEVKARRGVDKGKGRDPREGPGLGPKYGEKDQPIEILSEDEEDEQILEFEDSEEGEEEEEGEGAEDPSEEEEREEEEQEGEEQDNEEYDSEHSANVRDDRSRKRQRLIAGEYGGEDVDEIGSVQAEDEELIGDGEGGEEEYGDEEGGVDLLPDDEVGPFGMKYQRQQEDEFLSDEEVADAPSSPARFEEDAKQVEEYGETEAQEFEEVQPPDDDTSFPQRSISKAEPTTDLVDIRDPWAEVERYAQDYYAGGEVIPDARGHLSAHRLGINDDGSGLPSPDVANNPELEENEEDGEDGEGEPEYEMEGEDMEGDEARGSDDFDENEHLFNRLQHSYARRGAFMSHMVSDARGQQTFGRQHVPFGLGKELTGSGTTEEPIMIDSDDEAESPMPPVRRPQQNGGTKEEEETEAHTEEKADEVEEEVHLKKEPVGEELFVFGAAERGDILEEPSEGELIPANEVGAQGTVEEQPHPVDQHFDGETHTVLSTITPQPTTAESNEQTPSEVAFLPTPPAEPSTATDGVVGPHGRIEVSDDPATQPSPDQTTHKTGDPDLGFSPAPPQQEFDRHVLVDASNIPLHSYLEVPVASLQHTMNGTREAFGLEGVRTRLDFGGHNTIHTRVQTHTRGGSVTLEEEVDEDELDEWDELDEPGAFPLMTSDLAYPDEVDADDMDRELTSEALAEPVTSGGYTMPSEVIEIEDENEGEEEVKISVEEPEEYDAGSPPEEFVINVETATPLVQSRQNSPAAEKKVHFEEQPLSPKLDVISESDEGATAPRPSSPPVALPPAIQEATPKGFEAGVEPIVIDVDVSISDMEEPIIETLEEALKNAENIAVVVEEDTTHLPKDHILFDASDQPAYSVEEPFTDSEYRGSEDPQRDMSIGITSVNSDEVMTPTIEKGHVEETASDVERAEVRQGAISHEEVFSVAEEAQWVADDAGIADLDTPNEGHHAAQETEANNISSAHALPSPSPETDDDYFAQPGSLAITSAAINLDVPRQTNLPTPPHGGLPSIIQLPGTSQKVLSPVSTPGPGPTPVSIAVEPTVLRALKADPTVLRGLSSPAAPSTLQPLAAVPISPIVAIPKEEDADQQQLTVDISSPSRAGAFMRSAADDQPSGDSVPTSFPVATVAGKPTLFSDPYPYSLSTPGPPNQVAAEEGSEEDTEQDNSLSSASPAEKESDETVFRNVADLKPISLPSGPITLTPAEAETGQAGERMTEVEEDIIDIEAEADALINEFLVDEPESDTDADGEADPEFVDLQSNAGRGASEESVGKDIEEVNPLEKEVETKKPSMEGALEVPGTPEEAVIPGSEAEKESTEGEEDPFKLMGNDSLVAPGGALDTTPNDEESESEADVAETVLHESKDEKEDGKPVEPAFEKSQDNLAPSAQVEVQVQSPQPPPPSQSIGAPKFDRVGDLPYHAAVAEYTLSRTSTLKRRSHTPTPSPSVLEQVSVPVYSLQHKQVPLLHQIAVPAHSPQQEGKGVVTEPANGTTEKSPPKRLSLVIKEMAPPTTETTAEGPKRKVHISVEDPYNADNDSDHERGSTALRPGKRKRSRSDASTNDLPPLTPKSISMGQTKRKATSSRSITKGSRPRKESSRKRNLFDPPSRSPSVASTAISDTSFLTQLSPTHPPLASTEPRPFLHAHSRKKRNNAPTTVQEQLHKQLLKPASVPRSHNGILRAEDVLTKAPSISSLSTSSPVTRSHCRYHKISLPKTEDGPRINFLVPGCSLNDETLIAEEEIEDHGEAIIQGDTHIVDDIQTLDFEPYLLWVMRQLVGTEILRENEVFYLPKPGEEIVRKPLKPEKKTISKSKTRHSKLAGENPADGPRDSTSGRSASQGSSIASSSTSVLQQILGGSDIEELSTVTETEDEKTLPPKPAGKAPGIEVEGMTGRGGPPSKPEVSTFSRKRARRLGQDAAAYKPSTDDDGTSLASDTSDYNPPRKPSRNRGLKRPRTSEANVTEGVEGRKSKKSKTQLSPNHQSPIQPNPGQSLPQSQAETQTQSSVI